MKKCHRIRNFQQKKNKTEFKNENVLKKREEKEKNDKNIY